jgi:heavy metal-binding protein
VIAALALLLSLAQFWCSMHPDERSETAARCRICGMAMVRMPPAKFVTYPVDLRATPLVNGVRLRLAVQDPATRAVVRRFAIVHERPMHLFVIGDGLEFFAHEHPVQQPDGVFMIDLALPRAGPYMAVAEFQPERGTAQMFQQVFTTGAAIDRPSLPAVDVAPKIVDGVRVSVDASKVKSGVASALSFRVDDPASGAEVTDLEPYLGAAAHLLIVSADLTEAIHGHPDEDRRPALTFTPIVPKPGRYKVWLQVQRAGKVTTAAFVLEVAGT